MEGQGTTGAEAGSGLQGRSFLKELDFSTAELNELVALAGELKAARAQRREHKVLAGRNIALLFEKSSTRTRSAFEVAAHDQGAQVSYIGQSGSHLGVEESLEDTARVLGRLYDGIAYRGHGQARVEALASSASVPVWNGLTDEWHPTQTLADVLTLTEVTGKAPGQLSLCFLGDTRSNVARSLVVGGAVFGMDVRLCGPEVLRPPDEVVVAAEERAGDSGGRVVVTEDLDRALVGVDAVYTDVWVSMGEPVERWAERVALLRPYRVTHEVLAATKNPGVKFLHCLPALHDRQTTLGDELYRSTGLDGVEVTDEVFGSEASVVFEQAENRLHTIKALMVATLGDPAS